MSFQVTILTATGVNGPMEVPADFFADNPDPTALEVAAEFTRRMVEDHAALGTPRNLGFRAPLSIIVDEVD